MKDLSDGSGTFIKIQIPLKLVTGTIFSFGDNHIATFVTADSISLKFLEGTRCKESFTFDKSKMPVCIGRIPSNDIVISSIAISKKQCKYDSEQDSI